MILIALYVVFAEEEIAAAIEAENAVHELVRSWREFAEEDGKGGRLGNHRWWRAAEFLMLANNRLADILMGRDRSPASVKAYADFRRKMILGQHSRLNA